MICREEKREAELLGFETIFQGHVNETRHMLKAARP